MRPNTLVKDEEIKTLKEELVNWVSRQENLKQKKDRYKEMKRSMIVTHEGLTNLTEQKRTRIITLRARLLEARRTARLQIST